MAKKNIHDLFNEQMSSMFTNIFKDVKGVSTTKLIFPHIGVLGIQEGLPDNVGREALMGATIDAEPLLSAGSKEVNIVKTAQAQPEVRTKIWDRFTKHGGQKETLARIAGSKDPSIRHIVVAWDPWAIHKRAIGHGDTTHGAGESVKVSSKELMHRFFPDVNYKALTKENILDISRRAAGGEDLGPGSKFLGRAFRMFDKDLTSHDTAEVVFHAAYMRAQEGATDGPYNMKTFKRVLSRGGLKLDDMHQGVFSTIDPYGIGNFIKKGMNHGFAPLDYYHSAMNSNRSELLEVVRKIAGNRYSEKFSEIVDILNDASVGGKGAIAIKDGAIYLGQHGDFSSFKAMPVGYAGTALGKSDMGMISGTMNIGGRFALVPNIRTGPDGATTTVVEEMLNQVIVGLNEHRGTTKKNLGIAISHAANLMRHKELGTSGATLSQLQIPAQSRATFSFYRGIYNQGGLFVGGDAYAQINQSILRVFDQVQGRGGSILGAANRYIDSVGDTVQTFMPYVNKAFIPALKISKEGGTGMVPIDKMGGYFLPGTEFGKREQTKGRYGKADILEIWRPDEIRAIEDAAESRGLSRRASTVGVIKGDLGAELLLREVYKPESSFARTYNIKSSAKPVVMHNYLIGVLEADDLAPLNEIFGDSGMFTTDLGKRSRGGMLTQALQHETMKNPVESVEYLQKLAGKYAEDEGWKRIFSSLITQNLQEGPILDLQEGLRIDKATSKGVISPNVDRFMGFNASRFNEGYMTFYYGTTKPQDARSALLYGETRYTERAVQQSVLDAEFGSISKFAHALTSSTVFGAANPINTAFFHRTGLLGTQFAEQKFDDPVRTFMERYVNLAGEGNDLGFFSLPGEPNRIVNLGNFNFERYEKFSRQVLQSMEFTEAQVEAFAFKQKGKGEGIMHLLAKNKNRPDASFTEHELTKVGSNRRARLFFAASADRFSAYTDVQNQKNAFSMRLENLNLLAQSMKTDDPYYRFITKEFERQTEVQLTPGERAPHRFVKKFTPEIEDMFAPFNDKIDIRAQAKKHGMQVLTVAEAGALYGKDISIEALDQGITPAELRRTRLMAEGRKAFFVELSTEHSVPMGLDGKVMSRIKYQYIPSAERLNIFGAEDMDVKVFRETIAHATVNLLHSFSKGPEEHAKALEEMNYAYARYAGKYGVLDNMLMARMPYSGKGRLVSGRFKSISETQSLLSQEKLSSKFFEVGISKSMVHQMTKGDKKAREEAMAILSKKGGFLYGAMIPRPTHEGGQLMKVKFVLNEGKDAVRGNPSFELTNFLAWVMERDFDKDNTEGFLSLLGGKNKTFKELGINFDKLEKAYNEQTEGLDPLFQMYKKWSKGDEFLDQITEKYFKETITDFNSREFHKNLSAYFGFGKLPPASFLAEYPIRTTAGLASTTATSQTVADDLMGLDPKSIDNAITAADIDTYRKAMAIEGMTTEEVWREAAKLQRNPFQATITKAGKHFETLVENFLSIKERVASQGGTPYDAVALAEERSEQLFRDLMADKKFKVTSKIYAGLTEEETIKKAAKIMGRVQGTSAYMFAKHWKDGKLPPHLIRQAIGGVTDKSDAIGNVVHMVSNQRPSVWYAGNDTQDRVAAANNAAAAGEGRAMKASSVAEDFTSKAIPWLADNWKGVGIGAGALLGLAALYNIVKDDEVDRPPIRMPQSPLPMQPNVYQDSHAPSFSTQPQKAYVTPPRGEFGYGKAQGSFNSVNTNEMRHSFAQLGGQSSLNIRDSRSFKSNYELQAMADSYDRSDYIHPYQGDVI